MHCIGGCFTNNVFLKAQVLKPKVFGKYKVFFELKIADFMKKLLLHYVDLTLDLTMVYILA